MDSATDHRRPGPPPVSAPPERWLAWAWSQLEAGVQRNADGLHTGQFATVDGDGAPSVRTVVLRAVEPAARMLTCHSDARSPKLGHIHREPRVSWCFHDRGRALQLRLSGPARAHLDDELANARWAATRLGSRRCYLAADAPGTPCTAWNPGVPADLAGRRPDLERTRPGRVNFAVIVTVVERFDLLHLSSDGHRRLQFDFDGQRLQGGWVQP